MLRSLRYKSSVLSKKDRLALFSQSSYQLASIHKNPHQQEINRLEKKPELIKKDREYFEQTFFFTILFDDHQNDYPLWSAIPNGGKRLKGERWRLMASGQKAGMPDTQFMMPCNGYSGLFIEFKKPIECYKSASEARAAVKSHQVATLRMLATQGYAVRVAFGAREAIEIFKAYKLGASNFSKLPVFYPPGLLQPLIPGESVELLHGNFVAA